MFEQVDIGELGEDVINNLQNRAVKKKINLEYTGGPAPVSYTHLWILSLTGIQSDNFIIQMFKPTSFSPVLAIIGVIFIPVSYTHLD